MLTTRGDLITPLFLGFISVHQIFWKCQCWNDLHMYEFGFMIWILWPHGTLTIVWLQSHSSLATFCCLCLPRGTTVNPLYNDIRYNSKIRYNVNSVRKSADHVFFHWQSHVILEENVCFLYLQESPRRGDSSKYTKRMIHKETVQKYLMFIL